MKENAFSALYGAFHSIADVRLDPVNGFQLCATVPNGDGAKPGVWPEAVDQGSGLHFCSQRGINCKVKSAGGEGHTPAGFFRRDQNIADRRVLIAADMGQRQRQELGVRAGG